MSAFVDVRTDDSNESDSNMSDEIDKIEENESEADNEEETDEAPVSGLASVMSDILGKQKLKKTVVILAKGKSDKQIALKKRKQEEEEESIDSKKPKADDGSRSESIREQHLKKSQWIDVGRVKPGPLDREAERKLQRIATRGVVQLFNAVRKQQKDIDEKLNEVGSSVRKRDKVMKSVSKGAFLDMLKGTKSNVSADLPESGQTKQVSNERLKPETEKSPSWKILREDFMMGASMKDWDKASDDEAHSESGNDDPDENSYDSSDLDT